LKALLAYPGPKINPAALTERSAASASLAPHAFPGTLVPSPFETATLKQSETPNWLP
jgi:mannose-6-phosphate isomerase